MRSSSSFWSSYARCYDGLLELVPYQRLIDRSVAKIPPNARRLLDVGCGTGNLLKVIRERLPQVELVGLDSSPEMLKRANQKVAEAILLQGDLNEALPYPDDVFDVVTCVNVLYAVYDPQKTLSELHRVLAPGGTLIVTSPKRRPQILVFVREHARAGGWLRTIPALLRLTPLILFNLVILWRGKQQTYHFLDPSILGQWLESPLIESAYSNQNWFATVVKGTR